MIHFAVSLIVHNLKLNYKDSLTSGVYLRKKEHNENISKSQWKRHQTNFRLEIDDTKNEEAFYLFINKSLFYD